MNIHIRACLSPHLEISVSVFWSLFMSKSSAFITIVATWTAPGTQLRPPDHVDRQHQSFHCESQHWCPSALSWTPLLMQLRPHHQGQTGEHWRHSWRLIWSCSTNLRGKSSGTAQVWWGWAPQIFAFCCIYTYRQCHTYPTALNCNITYLIAWLLPVCHLFTWLSLSILQGHISFVVSLMCGSVFKHADSVSWILRCFAYYIRWVRNWEWSLQVHCSLSHYQWLEIDRVEFITQDPVIHLSLLVSLSDSLSLLSLSQHQQDLLRPESRKSTWISELEPSILPGKLPRACWAFNKVQNDLCCFMYRK